MGDVAMVGCNEKSDILIVSNVSAETGSEVNAINQDTSVKPI